MRTLDRYLAGIFLRHFLLGVFALAFLFLFQAILSDIIDHVFPTEQILVYQLLNLPQVLVQMSPPAILLATVFTLSGLNRTHELVACFSIGQGIGRILGLFLALTFVICCVVLVFQDRILPASFRKRTTYYWREMKKRPDFFLDLKRDKVWYRSKNLIYNLQTFDPKSYAITGMSVYSFDEHFNLVEVVEAQRAQYSSQGWKLKNGTVTVFSPEDPFPLSKKFETKDLVIGETPKDFMEIEREVDGLRFKEFYRYIQRQKAAGADTRETEVKFHSKISMGFIPLIMCILAVPFSVRNRREGGIAKDLGLCLGLTFFYWLFYSVGLSLGSNGALPPWVAAWLPSVIFGALAGGLVLRRSA